MTCAKLCESGVVIDACNCRAEGFMPLKLTLAAAPPLA